MKRLYWSFGILICLCWAGASRASDLPGMSGSRDATTYDNGQRDGCGPVIEVSSLPYDTNATLVGAGDNCGIRTAEDHIYHVNIPQTGSYTFSLCGGTQGNTDTYIYLMTQCCSGTEIARDNDGCGTYAGAGPSLLECITLSAGTYYLVVEAANANSGGPYSLHIDSCANACEQTAFEPGTDSLSETSRRFVQTVDSSSPAPYYYGPWVDDWPCAETGGDYGFDFLSWHGNDFDWWHSWPGYDDSSIVSIDSAFVYICAWDVDEPCEMAPVSRQVPCEMDLVSLGGGGEARPLLPHLEGVSQGWSVTRFLVDSADLRDDSLLHVQLEIDADDTTCNWAVKVHRSQLVVYYTINRSPNTPECSASGCVTAESLLCVTATASDPDGDNVYLEYRWYLLGAPASDTDSCLSEEIHAFEDWTCKVWAVDEHGVRSEPCSTVFNIMESCQENPTLGFDYGDLDTCYHTGTVNEGGPSNPIKRDNVAWLGDAVSVDQFAHSPSDTDDYDDGVVFLDRWNWLPCAQVCVDVTITTGPGFDPDIDSLYLYGFKDGSFPANCSFTDSFCNPRAYECIIQGVEITGLQANSDTTRRFCFTDPGVLEGQGRYNGIFRFRLLTQYVSPCVDAVATNDPVGGETEDYIITDLQLPVELLSFQVAQDGNAVVLRWSTASERENDYFRIERRISGAWSTVAARIRGAGSSSVTHTYSYRDAAVEAGTIYEYRLTSVDYNGTVHALGTQSIPVVQHDPVMVSEYRLYPNYPNPFNPTTTIAFDLAEAGHALLRVYDVMGREVAVLVNGNMPAGRHREVFDAQGLPSGVYVYKLTSGSFTDMQKMVLLK